MNGLVLTPARNSPDSGSPHDASNEFQPKAGDFARIHGLPAPVIYQNSVPPAEGLTVWTAPYGHVLSLIDRAPGGMEVLAIFGHGLKTSLNSAGIGPGHMPRLAEMLQRKGTATMKVILYSCLAGSPGGPAEQLSNLLGPRVTVYSHATAGPSTANPHWVRYPGGRYVIPKTDLQWEDWRQALLYTDLWAWFPFLDDSALRRRLDRPTYAGGGAFLVPADW